MNDEDLVYLDLSELTAPIMCEGPDCKEEASWSIGHLKCGAIAYACAWHTIELRIEQKSIRELYKCTRCGDIGLPVILFSFTKL